MSEKTFAVHTLGCKVNSYESNAISAILEKNGLKPVNFEEIADIYIINTCSVTNTGDKKSRQMIRRAKRQNPDAFIAVLGCYAQSDPEDVKALGVNLVAGTSDRNHFIEMILESAAGSIVKDISKVSEFEYLPEPDTSERTRAYIKIQDGCNNFCSYCIIPYTRGRVRSKNPDSVIAEAKALKEAGFLEIVLTGIEVASYGKDLGDTSLIDLLERLSKEVAFERIRLSSIDPRAFTDDFISRISLIPGVCHHFHISAQSLCTETLKRMNRHYTAEGFLDILEKIRTSMPDAAITTDIITGFPGETEEEFAITCKNTKKAAFSRLHVFPYSERRGTVAAKMEQIPLSVRSERAKLLIEEGLKLSKAFSESFTGKTVSVLFEEGKDGVYEGYTENYVRVAVKSERDLSGEIHPVKIMKLSGGTLLIGVIDNL
ncbi:MAG: tRNA (N(6)-L-threonylcarbamoyladenosine(37)-C(2))-methylthiotransferase MtaB [Clostridia bacterium]|nr:tRNA (N(6)-L-threonylcarbamoyladenosine(37)-C(2))-methylthiotransferase MtaB [Clostridia bacterium]